MQISPHPFTLLHFAALHFTSLHFTSLHFTSLHFTSLHFTSLACRDQVTADFTRSIYSEQATFTDEIDTYEIDKYVAGTKALFDAKLSNVAVDGTVQADPDLVSFRFKEKLTFNIPFKPYVMLSGRVELKRDPKDGLIYNSREFWDETPSNVIKSVKFN